MSRRAKKSPLARAFGRAASSLTRAGLRAGRKVAEHAADTVKAIAAQSKPPAGPGDWIPGQANCAAGARRFFLFRPPTVSARERLPLLVMLHGCGQNAAGFARSTRMNRIAVRERFLVLYPEQSRTANPQGCWEWYALDSGKALAEAAILMAAIDQVCLFYPVDRDAVAVAGISAGAGMAALLATRHPERFRAVAMHSGVPPGSAHSATSAIAAMSGHRLPALPTRVDARPPLLVIHGRLDRVVSVANARAAAEQWAAAGGAHEGDAREVVRGARHPMQITDFRRGRDVLARLTVIDRLGHAWSGGDGREHFSDPQGPDASGMVWQFFASQLRQRAARA